MYQNIKKRTEGFTIIEVLIVLAIAGLIMLIVFLAVPALQRNSRNTQRRDDVAKLLAAVTEYSNNNNGQMPVAWVASSSSFTNHASTPTSSVPVQLGFYQTSQVTLNGSTGNVNSASNVDAVTIATNHMCFGNDVAAPKTRTVAALYRVEPEVNQCDES